jgi:4-hydroxybenzoate polyprenyltransferase
VLDFLKAIRPANVLMVALAQTLLLNKYQSFSLKNLLLLILTSLWVIWGNLDNDIQDFELDAKFKGKKSNKIIIWLGQKSRILLIERLLLFISLIVGMLISSKTILVFIFSWTGLKFYNLYFKKMPLIGNLVIASLCALSLHIFDLGIAYNISILTCLIFAATLLRELIKDKEDEKADKAFGFRTFAILCPAVSFKIILYFLGILLSALAYHFMSSVVSALVVFLLLQIGQFYYVYIENWKQASLMIKLQILSGVLMIGFT